MIGITAGSTILATVVLLTVYATSICAVDPFKLANAPGLPKAAMTRTSSARAVLTIPRQDCGDASVLLARVTRHIRDAEQSAWYSPDAEDDYDDALQAIIETRCAEGIEDLRASDRLLRRNPDAELFLCPDKVR